MGGWNPAAKLEDKGTNNARKSTIRLFGCKLRMFISLLSAHSGQGQESRTQGTQHEKVDKKEELTRSIFATVSQLADRMQRLFGLLDDVQFPPLLSNEDDSEKPWFVADRFTNTRTIRDVL
jgi:hypothetical protein